MQEWHWVEPREGEPKTWAVKVTHTYSKRKPDIQAFDAEVYTELGDGGNLELTATRFEGYEDPLRLAQEIIDHLRNKQLLGDPQHILEAITDITSS